MSMKQTKLAANRQPVADAKPIGIEQAAKLVVTQLHKLANVEKAKAAQRYFAEPIQALGIDAAVARRLALDWVRRVKPTWHLRDAVDFCDLLLPEPHLDTRMVGVLIVGGFAAEFDHRLWRQAETWLAKYLDNWALVDGFASAVLSPLLRRDPEGVAVLRRWANSKCLWVRRAAVVTLVPFARRGEHLDLAFELIEGLLADKEDLMHKALGWLLRETGKPDPKRLKEFLLRHRSAIPRTSVRYSIERFPADERAQLLAQTRLA